MSNQVISSNNNILTIYDGIDITPDTIIFNKGIEFNNQIDLLSELIIKKFIKVSYPVGSIFISRIKYDLNNTNSLINTPLYYGKWVMIDDTGVIGTANSSYAVNDATKTTTQSRGDKQIQVNQIPPHKHQYQYNPGRKAKYNSNYEYSWTPRTDYTGADIYDKNNNKQTQVDFIPYGYYFFVYKKIEL